MFGDEDDDADRDRNKGSRPSGPIKVSVSTAEFIAAQTR
jgi:hypothetical protein